MRASLITPSYIRDAQICRDLCASVDEHVAKDIEHVLIIPRRDKAHFDGLASARRRIIHVEDLLPWYFVRAPLFKKLWLTPFSIPVRGWILQQIIKLSANAASDADVFLFADSDVTFVRPVTVSSLTQGDRVRLYRLEGATRGSAMHTPWHRAAARLFGLPPTDYFGADYIAQLVTWRRDVLEALQGRIAQTAGTDWRIALARTLHFSEYVLYGVFAEHVMGEKSGHFYTNEDLSHSSWHYSFGPDGETERYADEIGPGHIAIHIQSNQRVPLEKRRELVARAKQKIFAGDAGSGRNATSSAI